MALRDIFKAIRLTVADICIILAVLLSALAVFYFASVDNGSADVCIIEINGEEYARYDLPFLKEAKVIEIDNSYGKNTVVIDKDGAQITESDCEDKLEVKSGKITKQNQSLICLPHRLTVRLEGAKNIDGTSW